MDYIYNKMDNLLNIENDFVILDVDRTIINTTSWYKACICEDLLISKSNIENFIKINNKTFKNPTVENLTKFRTETLKLIEKRISDDYISKINEISNIDLYFTQGDYTNIWRFYAAGRYTAKKLVKTYEDAIKYIKYTSKYYGNNLKIIFLTSGYEPFIRGVVDEIVEENNLKNLNYLVVGSEIQIESGNIKEVYHIDQFEKQKIVETIINKSGKIRFLADDSNENEMLFDIVTKNGGTALKIKHISNQEINQNWQEVIHQLTEKTIKEKVKNDDSYVKLNNNIESQLPEFLQKLLKTINKIGVVSMKQMDYEVSVKNLEKRINNIEDKNNLNHYLKKFIFKKENIIYLRGKMYYNWLPQYIFTDNRTLNERWKELMDISIKMLDIFNRNNIFEQQLTYFEQLIFYSIIDHLLEGILFVLNLIEQNSLNNVNIYRNEHQKVIQVTQEISDLLYAFIYMDSRLQDLVNSVLLRLEKLEIIKKLPRYTEKYKTMRELDDNLVIFKQVKSIVDEIENRKLDLDYLISFPYGGIALGFAIKSYMRIVLNKKELPKLLNSHFSSKQKIREERTEKDADFSIFKFIPQIYSNYVENIKKGENYILLLDNNVTTFKTLDICKNFLKQIGNHVYASVAAINYNNIVNYIVGKECEELVPNWRQVLDFYPVSEYVTAFNTWNTSEKTKYLQELYYIKDYTYKIKFPRIKEKNENYIFKVCRVQNVQDLCTVIENRANMIGIHAVYPDRVKYLKNELKYLPIENNFEFKESLPIGVLELSGIQDMQKFIPHFIKQAILFERPLRLEDMIETCNVYKIPQDSMYIQLQHRTNEDYINNIKENLCQRIIVTIGLFQKDFQKYFWKIHSALNPKTDYILVDLSKHQPDLISYSEDYKDSIDRIAVLNHVSKMIENNDVPIMLADDTTTKQMNEYLKIISKYNIKLKGIDMQNTVEIQTNQQRYQNIECDGKQYQIKIRKSSTKMAEWNEFFDKIDKNIFDK